MKYALFAFYTLGVTASVLDDTPTKVRRDVATITNVAATVSQSLSALDNAVQAFQGDPAQLNSAAAALESTLSSATNTIQGTSPLNLADALSLQSVATSLQSQAQLLVNNLANKKPQIQQASLCDTIRQQSDQLGTQSQSLIDAIVDKVPAEVQGLAGQMAEGFTLTLRENSANFSPSNCTNANGGVGGLTTTTSQTRTTGVPVSSTTRNTGGFLPTGTGLPGTSRGPSTARPTGTGGFGVPTATSRPPVVTAAAASNAVSLGGVALMVAAFLA